MAWSGVDPSASDDAHSPAYFDERDRIGKALTEADAFVARMHASPTTAELRRILESSRQTLDAWRGKTPSHDEQKELLDQVERTLNIARSASPTVRIRRTRRLA